MQCTGRILSIMNIIYICFPADFLVWTLVSRYRPLISTIILIIIFKKIISIILQYVTQKQWHLNTKQQTQSCVKYLLYRKSSVHIHWAQTELNNVWLFQWESLSNVTDEWRFALSLPNTSPIWRRQLRFTQRMLWPHSTATCQ